MTDIPTIAASLSETNPTHYLLERLDSALLYEAHGEVSDLPERAAEAIRELEAENMRLREIRENPAIKVSDGYLKPHDPETGKTGKEIGQEPQISATNAPDLPNEEIGPVSAISGETGK